MLVRYLPGVCIDLLSALKRCVLGIQSYWHQYFVAFKKLIFGRKQQFWAQRGPPQDNLGQKTACPAAKWTLTGKLNPMIYFNQCSLAFYRLPAQCLQCPSPSSRGTPMPSATSTLKQISERLTTLRFYYQKVGQFTYIELSDIKMANFDTG